MKSKNYNAFFIKPTKPQSWRTPKIIAVPDRHIVEICRNPKSFGLEKSEIEKIYKRYNENIGWEGYARNEIILSILKPPVNFARIRYNQTQGCWRIQIYEEMNTTICTSILYFFKQVKKGAIRDLLKRSSYPYYNVEIHTTIDTTLFVGKVDEGIEFVEEAEKQNMIVRKCHLLGGRGKVEIISMEEERQKKSHIPPPPRLGRAKAKICTPDL